MTILRKSLVGAFHRQESSVASNSGVKCCVKQSSVESPVVTEFPSRNLWSGLAVELRTMSGAYKIHQHQHTAIEESGVLSLEQCLVCYRVHRHRNTVVEESGTMPGTLHNSSVPVHCHTSWVRCTLTFYQASIICKDQNCTVLSTILTQTAT